MRSKTVKLFCSILRYKKMISHGLTRINTDQKYFYNFKKNMAWGRDEKSVHICANLWPIKKSFCFLNFNILFAYELG